MYNVSAAFLQELRRSSMLVAVEVVASNGTILSVEDGSVDMDSTRNITRTASLTLTPTETLSAIGVYNLVMTPGIEITIRRGLIINGITEYVTLGVFTTDSADFSIDVEGTVSWTGSDRSKRISRARFVNAYKIVKNTLLATAGADLLLNRYAETIYNFSNVLDTIEHKVVYDAGDQSDPWASARKLFGDHGFDLHFNGDGTAVAKTVPDPATEDPVFDFGAGETNLVLDGTISGTLEATFNGVVATGEGSGNRTPKRSVVWDTDPTSPTFFQGGFGQIPYFYSSPLLTSTAKCTTAATAILAQLKGSMTQLSWTAVTNPALEPLDVIAITYNGVTSRFVIDALTIPLRASDAITARARETSTVPFSVLVEQNGAN
jgi:hypothetical protein